MTKVRLSSGGTRVASLHPRHLIADVERVQYLYYIKSRNATALLPVECMQSSTDALDHIPDVTCREKQEGLHISRGRA